VKNDHRARTQTPQFAGRHVRARTKKRSRRERTGMGARDSPRGRQSRAARPLRARVGRGTRARWCNACSGSGRRQRQPGHEASGARLFNTLRHNRAMQLPDERVCYAFHIRRSRSNGTCTPQLAREARCFHVMQYCDEVCNEVEPDDTHHRVATVDACFQAARPAACTHPLRFSAAWSHLKFYCTMRVPAKA
jgi:hypothetical protein